MAKAAAGKSGKKKGLKIDFTGVEVRLLIPEGDYHAKVKAVTLEEGNTAQYLKWQFSIVDDDAKINGQSVYTNTSLAPQALWNLRNLLETLGVETPDSEMELDLEALKDLELMLRVEHETYEGKDRAKVADFQPLTETAEATDEPEGEEETEGEEEAEAETEEEEPAEDEEDTVSYTAEEVKAMGEKELKDLIKLHKLSVKIDGLEKKPKKRAAMVIDALEKAELLGE